ncbi:MAG TPA: ABC transporter permease [Thermoplasmatales archaeon]|nr:ABC transporter permease [Thermoplasmatales archaeon]
MNHLLNIIKKEVKELLTPATIIPIVVMAFLFGGIGNMIGGTMEEAQKKPLIGIVDNDNGVFSSITKNVTKSMAEVIYDESGEKVDEGLEILKEKGGTALFLMPENFTYNILNNISAVIHVYWIMKGAGIMDMVSSDVVENIMYQINQKISEILIEKGKMNSSFVLSPIKKEETTIFKGKEMEGISPSTIGNILSSQSTTVPIIMMIIIIMAGGMVISSMGMEKENKTLETLLTLPVRRSSIVFGKIVGSAIVGLIMAIVYMIGFSYYINSFQQSMEINLAGYGISLNFFDYVLIGISVFFSLLSALSLCMVLGTFAKNYKSAQTLTVPVSILAIIPMFIIMFKDFDTLPFTLKIILFAIPFSHPMMAMRSLLFKNYFIVIAGILYVAIFAFILIMIAVWVFKTDKLITGRIKSPRKFFMRR